MIRSMRSHLHLLFVGCLILSVTAASAPAPDKAVMGIELGSRFLLPECGGGSGTFASQFCINKSLTNRKAWGADEYYVSLPRSGVPPYVRGELKVHTVQGIVESVQVGTWGLQSQSGALSALTSQYGKPIRTSEKKKMANSRFAAQFAEWDLAEFTVKFEGSSGSIDWGLIDASTHRYQKLVKDYEKRQPAR